LIAHEILAIAGVTNRTRVHGPLHTGPSNAALLAGTVLINTTVGFLAGRIQTAHPLDVIIVETGRTIATEVGRIHCRALERRVVQSQLVTHFMGDDGHSVHLAAIAGICCPSVVNAVEENITIDGIIALGYAQGDPDG